MKNILYIRPLRVKLIYGITRSAKMSLAPNEPMAKKKHFLIAILHVLCMDCYMLGTQVT